MLTLGLHDMRFRARHGVHPDEAVLGGWFAVDLEVDLRPAVGPDQGDRLAETLDYTGLYAIAREVMAARVDLLETLAERIVAEVADTHAGQVAEVRVTVRKLNPPLGGGSVGAAVVRLRRVIPAA